MLLVGDMLLMLKQKAPEAAWQPASTECLCAASMHTLFTVNEPVSTMPATKQDESAG
jgi:hypothetical protein